MLKHIPFYASLLDRPLAENKKATQGHVLIYGAIEVHDMGEHGCIASNATLAKETGMKKESVAVYLSVMNKAGWIQVNVNPETNQRIDIKPLLVIADPLTGIKPPINPSLTPPLTGIKHRYIKEDIKNKDVRKEKPTISKYTSDDIRLTDSLYFTVAKLFPNFSKLVNRKPGDKDYMEMNKLHRIDGNEYKLIEDVLKWLYIGYKPVSDTFDWKDQIKSTYKFRKHFDQLRLIYEKDKKSGRYTMRRYSSMPPGERKATIAPVEKERVVSAEEAEKNKVILELIRQKKIAFSDTKALKSKPVVELREMLDSV